MTGRLLLVEDDRTLRETLCDALRGEGLEVTAIGDGRAAGDVVFARHFDVIVLDVMLPGRSGFEILREIRGRGLACPVLLLTVRGDEADRVLGFELGADDYVTKPFHLRELLARVRTLLQRARGGVPGADGALSQASPSHGGSSHGGSSHGGSSHGGSSHGGSSGDAHKAGAGAARFRVGGALVDLGAYEIERGGTRSPLSPREAAMLGLLFREAGRVVSRTRFLDEIWGGDLYVGHRTVDTHMLNLRQKLEPDPRHPVHLITVHGAGYRLILDPSGARP